MRNTKKLLLPLFIFAALSFGCKKELNSNRITIEDNTLPKASIPPYPFAWETPGLDYMTTPPNMSILLPWSSGASRQFSADLTYDYKNSEGWELVFNVFNSSLMTTPYYFTLYNRYRGLLRFYMYLPPNSPTTSTYISHGLSLAGSTPSHMLNYIGQDIVDPTISQATATKIENYQVLSTGGWYVTQYEMAYDPNVTNISYQNLNLSWNTSYVSITNSVFNGTQTGTLRGTVSTGKSGGFNLGGVATEAGKGALEATGLAVFDNNTPQDLGLTVSIFNAIKAGLSGGVTGVVLNIFNAIFGGSSSNTQEVHLTMNTAIALTGTSTSGGGIGNVTFAIPGEYDSQSAPGYTPGYNLPMGVFYISNRPLLRSTTHMATEYISYPFGGVVPYNTYQTNYTLDDNSFQLIFNPSVINTSSTGAQIENIKKEIIVFSPPNRFDAVYPIGNVSTYGIEETVGTYHIFSNVTGIYSTIGAPWQNWKNAVRISFDVVPNNGAPRCKIVKTFTADISNINI